MSIVTDAGSVFQDGTIYFLVRASRSPFEHPSPPRPRPHLRSLSCRKTSLSPEGISGSLSPCVCQAPRGISGASPDPLLLPSLPSSREDTETGVSRACGASQGSSCSTPVGAVTCVRRAPRQQLSALRLFLELQAHVPQCRGGLRVHLLLAHGRRLPCEEQRARRLPGHQPLHG